MQKLSNSAHSVLQYMITRAVLENKVGETIIKIPLRELIEDHGGRSKISDPAGIVLEINVSTSWNEGNDDDLEITMEDEDDYGEI
jgi:hypothetical protein